MFSLLFSFPRPRVTGKSTRLSFGRHKSPRRPYLCSLTLTHLTHFRLLDDIIWILPGPWRARPKLTPTVTSSFILDSTRRHSTCLSPIQSAMIIRATCSTASESSSMLQSLSLACSTTLTRLSSGKSFYQMQTSLSVLSSGSGWRPSTLSGR
jgi:hypothetical protein